MTIRCEYCGTPVRANPELSRLVGRPCGMCAQCAAELAAEGPAQGPEGAPCR